MNKRLTYLLILLLTVIYICFPNNNAGTDSWFYAASVKHGEALFRNHHLLYSAFGRIVYLILQLITPGTEAMYVLTGMNALAAGVCLLITYRLLMRLGLDSFTALTLTFACASSFGFMRFATDAETYILPLLFWLCSLWFIAGKGSKMAYFWAACFSAVSVLFHEIYIWWPVSVLAVTLFKQRRIKESVYFTLPLLLVPLVYYAVYRHAGDENGFMAFVSGEYARGNAGINLSLKSILLTGINFIRTFVQVHGYIPLLFKQFPVFSWLVSLLITSLVITGAIKAGISVRVRKPSSDQGLKPMLFIAFCLHLFFALLSSGNAEFMGMLPFILVLYGGTAFDLGFKSRLLYVFTGVFSWNLVFGILPASQLNISRADHQASNWEKHPAGTCTGVWTDRPLVHNILAYKRGFLVYDWLPIYQPDRNEITQLLKQGHTIYTDYGNPGTAFSRKALLNKDEAEVFDGFEKVPADSFYNLYGKNYIYRILPPK